MDSRPIPGADTLMTIRAHLVSPFAEMADLATLALLRLSEVVGLQESSYRSADGIILVGDTKYGMEAVGEVVLSSAAQRLVDRQLKSHHSNWVFPTPQGQPYSTGHVARQWRQAVQAVAIGHIPFSSQRLWGIQTLSASGVEPAVTMTAARLRRPRNWRWSTAPVTREQVRKAMEKLSVR
jgi:hypothetical protein